MKKSCTRHIGLKVVRRLGEGKEEVIGIAGLLNRERRVSDACSSQLLCKRSAQCLHGLSRASDVAAAQHRFRKSYVKSMLHVRSIAYEITSI